MKKSGVHKLERTFASAYFVGNVVDALARWNSENNAYAWYPLTDGKRGCICKPNESFRGGE